jgi:hypothetical protein
MSTRNDFDDLLDLSLRHSLKNLVARQSPPESGRERLLEAAAEQDVSSRQYNEKQRWLCVSFRFYNGPQEKKTMPGYGDLLDAVSILKSSMLVA